MPLSRVLLLALVLGGAVTSLRGADEPPVSPADEQTLKAAGLTPTAPGLAEFFRRRTQPPPSRDALVALVARLTDKATREPAAGELTSIGMPAVPLLRQAANELEDADAAARARACLNVIEGTGGSSLTNAAVRALTGLRPPGTVETLLAYLPLADDDSVADEITSSLTALAVKDGKTEPALLKALTDPLPLRRAIAAEILTQANRADARDAIRKLLSDPRPSVRQRTALSLAQLQDTEAVPALINLLGDLSAQQARSIEEYLAGLAGEWALTVPQGDDAVSRRLKRDLWSAWWKATDGPALLDELKKRTPSDAERERLQNLVARLGASSVAERDKATAELLALGATAAPWLRQAAGDRDGKSAEAAQKVLGLIDATTAPPLPAVAPRLLSLRRPPGAAEAILAYLPSAEDEGVSDELRSALSVLTVRDGKVEPAVVAALQDRSAVRRAAAGEALLATAMAEHKPAVKKLLADADLTVRLRVAIALAAARDKDAVPVLISLLGEMPLASASQAEEVLRMAAGEAAPEVGLGEEPAARIKARDAWNAWWQKNGDKVNLAGLDTNRSQLGYTVVVEQYDPTRRTGRIVEFDRRGKMRWQIEGLQAPSDAQVLPGDRVLICEQNAQRISERDLKGKTIWERQFNQPVNAQRLSNGNTLLVGRGQVTEIDRNNKELYTHNRPAFDIICGKKLRNGHIVLVTNQGLCIRMDVAGKELKTVRVPPIQVYNGYADYLPNDHVVVPLYSNNKVAEFDAQGKSIWEATITLPMSARRLPNGNTLVTTANPPRVVELDRGGKVVWENKDAARPTRADRR